MTRPPVRWAHCDLPDDLSRLVASAAPSHADDDALARMRARLHDTLGPSFETRVARPRPSSVLLRSKWLCAAALATAAVSFVAVERALQHTPQPTAAHASDTSHATLAQKPEPASAPTNAPRAAPAPASGLAAELQGLAEIRQLLQSSPASALTAAEAQQQHFAQGALGPERELLRIEALLRSGHTDEAKRSAKRALHASNNPPYRERIEKLFAQTDR